MTETNDKTIKIDIDTLDRLSIGYSAGAEAISKWLQEELKRPDLKFHDNEDVATYIRYGDHADAAAALKRMATECDRRRMALVYEVAAGKRGAKGRLDFFRDMVAMVDVIMNPPKQTGEDSSDLVIEDDNRRKLMPERVAELVDPGTAKKIAMTMEEKIKNLGDAHVTMLKFINNINHGDISDMQVAEYTHLVIDGRFQWDCVEKSWRRWTGDHYERLTGDGLVKGKLSDVINAAILMCERERDGAIYELTSTKDPGERRMWAAEVRKWRFYENNCRKYKDFYPLDSLSKAYMLINQINVAEEHVWRAPAGGFNTRGGVLNLITKVTEAHNPDKHWYTKITRGKPLYDLAALAAGSDWKVPDVEAQKKLAPMFVNGLVYSLPCPDTREYLLEYVASSWMLSRNAEIILYLWGVVGSNGKSELVRALITAMGGYATWLDPKTFTKKRQGNATQPELKAAIDMALAAVDEPDPDDMDSGGFKNAANFAEMAIRGLYEMTALKQWTASLIMLCNVLPPLDTKDAGNARRVRVIPFNVVVTDAMKEAELSKRPNEYRTFRYGKYMGTVEADGIITILLQAFLRFAARGYRLPPMSKEMQDATNEYIYRGNTVARYVNRDYVKDPEKAVIAAEFEEGFRSYCIDGLGHSEKRLMLKDNIRNAMAALEFPYRQSKKNPTGKNRDCYIGLRMKTAAEKDKEAEAQMTLLGESEDIETPTQSTQDSVVERSVMRHTDCIIEMITAVKWQHKNSGAPVEEVLTRVHNRGFGRDATLTEINQMVSEGKFRIKDGWIYDPLKQS